MLNYLTLDTIFKPLFTTMGFFFSIAQLTGSNFCGSSSNYIKMVLFIFSRGSSQGELRQGTVVLGEALVVMVSLIFAFFLK
jgi:hypothetical protein